LPFILRSRRSRRAGVPAAPAFPPRRRSRRAGALA
jgi:hypothetical protein